LLYVLVKYILLYVLVKYILLYVLVKYMFNSLRTIGPYHIVLLAEYIFEFNICFWIKYWVKYIFCHWLLQEYHWLLSYCTIGRIYILLPKFFSVHKHTFTNNSQRYNSKCVYFAIHILVNYIFYSFCTIGSYHIVPLATYIS